jgi:hypothetical protein
LSDAVVQRLHRQRNPRGHLIRYYGVWATHAADRAQSVPGPQEQDTALKQIIDSRPGFDEDNWSAFTQYGKNGAVPTDFTFNEEGDVIAAFSLYNYHAMKEGALSYAVVYARGTWKESDGEFDWTFGDVVELSPDVSSHGCIEPCTVFLGGGRLANAMRCQGGESRGIYSLRYVTRSEDSCRTWSERAPLCYEDGSTVWNPAACASCFKSSKTGKV